MFKKNNNSTKETNSVNKEEKKNKFYWKKKYIYYGVIIFFVVFISCFLYFKYDLFLNFFKNNYFINDLFVSNKEQFVTKDELENIRYSNNQLREHVNSLNSKILDLREQINLLESKLIEIKINPYKVELIRVALNIKDDIYMGNNISNNLSILNLMFKNIPNELKKDLLALEANKNNILSNDIIKHNFSNELKLFFKENTVLNKSYLNFFSKFIFVRKIKNIDSNNNSIDVNLITLEQFVSSNSFCEIVKFLDENYSYKVSFDKTYNACYIKCSTNNSIINIINYLFNND